MRCRRTYILNNTVGENDIGETIMLNKFGAIDIFNFSLEVLEKLLLQIFFASFFLHVNSLLLYFIALFIVIALQNIAIEIVIALQNIAIAIVIALFHSQSIAVIFFLN